jgi:hypothetical protein
MALAGAPILEDVEDDDAAMEVGCSDIFLILIGDGFTRHVNPECSLLDRGARIYKDPDAKVIVLSVGMEDKAALGDEHLDLASESFRRNKHILEDDHAVILSSKAGRLPTGR